MDSFIELGGLDRLEQEFATNRHTGITDPNFTTRRQRYGANVLPAPPARSWFSFFCSAMNSLTLKILCVTAAVSLLMHGVIPSEHTSDGSHSILDFMDPIAVVLCVVLVASTQAQVDFTQQTNFLEITKLQNVHDVTVVRFGREQPIANTELLVGDVLSLQSGDGVAADCVFISGNSLLIDSSQSTGESESCAVDCEHPFVLGGSVVESGDAHVLVCSVGEHSQFGLGLLKIQASAHDATILELKIAKICKQLTIVGVFGGAATLIVLLAIWLNEVLAVEWEKRFVNMLMEDVMVCLTIFICIVPEGLPVSVTFSLGLSMKWMVRDNIFVRHLTACETMGGATAICSDKTGTLTQNRLTVVKVYLGGKDNEGPPDLSESVRKLLSEAIAMNTTAYRAGDRFVGPSSECALLQFLAELGADYRVIRERGEVRLRYEFNSARKKMSTVVVADRHFRVLVKGAPDWLLGDCSHYVDGAGNRHELTGEYRDLLFDKVTEMADESLRTMLIGYSDLEEVDDDDGPESVERDLTVIGIVGIMDPIRPEVPKSIEACRRAGVTVRMVTGDFMNTAKAVAKKCGILTEDGIALTGAEFSSMSKLQLLDILPRLRVVARSSPLDKYRLVGLLRESGEVVAVTGDGSNDAIAMKRANCGLAMGKCGTELAKLASDIVVLDDDFSSIVVALKWGRCTYDNIRAFLTFQLAVSFAAMIVLIIGPATIQVCPIKAIQLLWANVIIGAIGALALATARPKDSLLLRPPYGEDDPLVSRLMIRNIIGQVIYEAVVLLILLFGYQKIFGFSAEDDALLQSTLVFNTFQYCNIVNLLNARVPGPHGQACDGFFTNWYFDTIFVVMVVMQALLVEFSGPVLKMTPLTWQQWLVCLAFGMGAFPYGFLVRRVRVDEKTEERLDNGRKWRQERMREFYQGMTAEEMWKIEKVPDSFPGEDTEALIRP